jgi:hypothetical protein
MINPEDKYLDGYLDGVCRAMPQSNDPTYINGFRYGWDCAFDVHKFRPIKSCPYPKPKDYDQE